MIIFQMIKNASSNVNFDVAIVVCPGFTSCRDLFLIWFGPAALFLQSSRDRHPHVWFSFGSICEIRIP